MVIFQAPGGSPGYNQFETLDSAVAFVEQLRNERDVSNARIFALEEVKFELKPYFRVELQALTRTTGQSSTADSVEAPVAATPRPAPEPSSQPAVTESAPGSPVSAPSAPTAPSAPAPTPTPTPQAAPPQTSTPSAPTPGASPAAPGADRDPQTGQPVRRGLFGR